MTEVKVGDVVVVTSATDWEENNGFGEGTKHIVNKVYPDGSGVKIDGWALETGSFKLAEPKTPALQIEEGLYYWTRDGRKVGPMVIRNHLALDDKNTNPVFVDGGSGYEPGHELYQTHHEDLISEYKEPEIKVGDLYTFVGEEKGHGYYTKGKTYKITGVYGDDEYTMSDNKGTPKHWWSSKHIEESFIPGSFGDLSVVSPIQTTTVNKIISGDYGRLRVSSDGFHALNLSIIDGRSRCVSVDEMKEIVTILQLIIEAKGS